MTESSVSSTQNTTLVSVCTATVTYASSNCSYTAHDFKEKKEKKIVQPDSWPSGKPRKPWEKGMK